MTNIEIIEKAVQEYIEKNGVSPFLDIEMGEENEVKIDMDTAFEENVTKLIIENGSNIEEAMGEYFTSVIQEMIEKLDIDDLEKELDSIKHSEHSEHSE